MSSAIFISDDLVIFCCCCCCFLDVIFVDVDCESNIESGCHENFRQARIYNFRDKCVAQRRKNAKLSGKQLPTRKNFPDEVRKTVSQDTPKKRVFASLDIAKECVMNVLGFPPPTRLVGSQQISPGWLASAKLRKNTRSAWIWV